MEVPSGSEVDLRAGNRGSLSSAEVSEYDQQGYLVIPDLLDESDMAPARQAMSQKVEHVARELKKQGLIDDLLESYPFETRLARLFDGLEPSHFLAFGRSWRDRFTGYYTLMTNPKILDAVESLIGSEIFSSPVYNVRPKVPRVAAGAVPWHQDKSYWPDAKSSPVVTVWIALVDATPENGCLSVIPRSQRSRVHGFHHETYSGTGYTELDDDVVDTLKQRRRQLPVRAGTAIVFDDHFVHSSGPNTSEHVRWSVDLRYQPADQDPMLGLGVGFLARSRLHPERVVGLDDWMYQGRRDIGDTLPASEAK